jgi:hypothetical protein
MYCIIYTLIYIEYAHCKESLANIFHSVFATASGLEIVLVEGFQKKDLLVICLLQLCKTIIAIFFACFYVRDCKNSRFSYLPAICNSTEENIIKSVELGTKQQRGIRKKAHNPAKACSLVKGSYRIAFI